MGQRNVIKIPCCEKLHYPQKVKTGNGYAGWPEFAPFDGIIVTAGGDIPPKLLEQLKPGGRMVIPVGDTRSVQYLKLIQKDSKGEITKSGDLPVRFVPLVPPR